MWAFLLSVVSVVAVAAGAGLRVATRPTVEHIEISAISAWNEGGVRQAELLARDALGRSEHAERAREVLMQVAQHDARPLLSVAALLSVPPDASHVAESRYRAGEIAYLNGFGAIAERACWECLEYEPLFAPAYDRLLGLAVIRLDAERVRELLHERAKRLPPSLKTIQLLFSAETLDRNAKTMEPKLRKFVYADPDDEASRVGLARCLNVIERSREACELLKQRPLSPVARVALAQAKLAQGHIAEALDLLPENSPQRQAGEYWSTVGALALAENRVDDAVHALSRAVELRPLNRQIRARFCEALRKQGDQRRLAKEGPALRIVQELYTVTNNPSNEWDAEMLDALLARCEAIEATEYVERLQAFRSRR